MPCDPLVSVVIAARNEGANLVDMVECLWANSGPALAEVVVVDDGSEDGSGTAVARQFAKTTPTRVLSTTGVGVAAARNRGAAAARGEVLVFIDGHCWCPPGWLETLTEALAQPGVGLVGPVFVDLATDSGAAGYGVTWPEADLRMAWLSRAGEMPYAVPLMPGGCDALSRSLFESLGGYDEGMGRWGSEGEELSLRVWLAGFEVQVAPACEVRHLFRARHPYAVDGVEVLHNRLRVATVHFSPPRIARVFERIASEPGFGAATALLATSDAQARRALWTGLRTRDDASWFERFSIGF
ncbi:MAG: glycosyltransferase [Thiotrichales bacterium]